MKKHSILMSALLLAMSYGSANAQSVEVPHYVNFQSVLRDDSGNLIADGFIDLEFKILDQDGDQVYYEQQPGVQVVRGSVNVMIGEGITPGSDPATPTGGLPTEAVDPASGAKYVQIQIGTNLPSEPIELGSVPYAMYAERALGLVADIAESAIPANFVTESELDAAIATEETSRTNADNNLQGQIDNEVAARTAGDTSLQGQVDVINSTLSNINNIPGTLNDNKIASTIARDSEVTSAVNSEATSRANGDANLQGQINTLNTTVSDHEDRLDSLEATPPLPQIVLSADIDGTTGALNAGYGVGSVSRVNTGLYTITFANPMSNSLYVVVGSGEEDGPSEGVIMAVTEGSKTTTGFGFRTVNMSDTHTDTRITLAVISIPQ